MPGITTKRRPLSSYLTILAAACVLPLVGLQAFNIASRYRADRESALAQLQLIQETTVSQIRAYLADAEHFLQQIAGRTELMSSNAELREARLRESSSLRTDLTNLAIVDQQGQVLGSVRFPAAASPASIRGRAPLEECLAAEGFHVSSLFFGELSQSWTCVLSYPVVNAAGERVATIMAPLDLPRLARQILPNPANPDLIAGVTTLDGTSVMRSRDPERWVGQPSTVSAEYWAELRAGKTSGVLEGRDGRERVYFARVLEGTTWIVGGSLPTAVIFGRANAELRASVVTTALLLVLLGVLVWSLSRAIARPVEALARAARSPADDLDGVPAPVGGPAEIADAADAYNQMLGARRAAQAALAERENLFRSVIEQTGQIVYDLDIATGTITWDGRAACLLLLGSTPEEFSALGIDGWKARIHPDDRADAVERVRQCLASGGSCFNEYRLGHVDGTYRLVEARGAIVGGTDGTRRRMVGRISDLTNRQVAEEERRQIEEKMRETQKLESLGVLAGGVAHDFNNLLTGVLGQASLARLETPAGAPVQEHLAQIEKSARRAADLCRQLLAYSGKGRFVVSTLDLGELVRDTAELLQVSISKQTVLRFDLPAGLPPVKVDATQLRQVIMNLVINASEAIGDRPGTVTLATRLVRVEAEYLAKGRFNGSVAAGDCVALEVADTGGGIDRELVDRIFDPFYTTKFTGRGLGLSAVLGIVRGHGGAIGVASEPGAGTRFTILLPVAPGRAEKAVPRAAVPPVWRGSGRILLVDDEEAVRQVAQTALEMFGFSVDVAADGEAGLELFAREPARFAAALVDLTMPRMDGEELFRRMRQIKPDVRVVLMSGYNRTEATNRFAGNAPAGFVQKPFEIDTLAAELRRIIEMAPGA